MSLEHKKSAVVLVFNTEGKLLLQQRALHDEKYPGHWDFSAAGGIDDGEDPKEAAKRELFEEIGIQSELVFLFEKLYEDTLETDYLYFYQTISEGPFDVDPKEVERVEFFTPEEIFEMIQSGDLFHPECQWFFPEYIKLGKILIP